jgi:hypothetical protein
VTLQWEARGILLSVTRLSPDYEHDEDIKEKTVA